MIQQRLKLGTELSESLKNCDELWIAAALISDSGYKFIQDHIKEDAIQHYLVGIGLPTSPNVLLKLKNLKVMESVFSGFTINQMNYFTRRFISSDPVRS